MCGSDFAVLEALLHKGPLPVNEIGKKILLTSGSITVAIDRLETKGLVQRRASGTDRRGRIVHLTKEGFHQPFVRGRFVPPQRFEAGWPPGHGGWWGGAGGGPPRK